MTGQKNRTGAVRSGYVRWHFPLATALILALTLVAFGDNLVTDVGQPSNSNPVMVVHGLFLLTWTVLLVVQASLPSSGRTDLHRRIGSWAFLIAIGVVASTLVLFAAVWKGWAAVSPEVLANRILLPSYAACMILAYRSRRTPQHHKRLVYCGTLLLLEPVLARTFDPLVVPFLPAMPPGEDMPIFYAYMVIVWVGFFAALAHYDRSSLGRVHPITGAALAWLFGTYAIAFALAPA